MYQLRDVKQFWKAVKYLNKAKSSIPVLKMDEVTAHSDVEKADMISEYFTTCFNQNIPPLDPGVPEDPDEGYASTEEFLCTTKEVFHLLVSLDTSINPLALMGSQHACLSQQLVVLHHR